MANPVGTLTMENGDVIKFELYPEIAPNTVNNFISSIIQQTVHYNSNKPYTGAARYNLEKVIKTDYLPDIATKKQKSIGE